MASKELFAALFTVEKQSNLLTLAKKADKRLAVLRTENLNENGETETKTETLEAYADRLRVYRGATPEVLGAFWEAQKAGESLREVCKNFVTAKTGK